MMVYVISALGKAPFSAGDLVPLTVPTQVYREVLRGNFVGGATSFWSNATTRYITISGIPAGATVVKALLFWGCECNSYSNLANINFNGTPITGTVVGSTGTLCWGTSYYLNYMADVTSLVPGNGTYSITVPSALSTTPGADGATLYVVYCSPSASDPIRTISIYAGAELIYPPSSLSWTQTGFTATSSPSAKVSFTGGDCQDGLVNNLYFNSTFVYLCDGSTPGNHYGYWESSSVSIPPSATSVTWRFDATSYDCVSPNVSVVSVTSVDPVTYTCVAGYEDPVFVDEKGNVYSEENVEAYDVTGKKVAEGKRFHLPKGVYILKYSKGTKRVIIK